MNARISLSSPNFIKLLSNDIRWQLLRLLSDCDLRVNEIVQASGYPQNLVSYHLQKLREHNLVREHRSAADGREMYYSLNLDQVRTLFYSSGSELHPVLGGIEQRVENEITLPTPARVLFLCTHNSARSQMAEAILRKLTHGQSEVFSAGTEPSVIHPLALQIMQDMNIDISRHYSKPLTGFLGHTFDYIITVCDRARESCPVFPGDPNQIHWSIPDPALAVGSEAERYHSFKETAVQLNTRIGYLWMIIQRDRKQAK